MTDMRSAHLNGADPRDLTPAEARHRLTHDSHDKGETQ